jgi:prevent-host-death family protein
VGIKFSEDIRSVTDLKRNTRSLLDQIHKTGRPVVLTVNGKADAVLMNAKAYEVYLSAVNLARELISAERDVTARRVRPARAFLKEFKRVRPIPS